MDKIRTEATVLDGRLTGFDREKFKEKLIAFESKDVLLFVVEREPTRRARANAYYWAVIVKETSSFTGYRPDEIHETFKTQLLPPVIVHTLDFKSGQKIAEYQKGSTRKLSIKDHREFTELCMNYVHDEISQEIIFPEPKKWCTEHPEIVERYQ